MGGERACVPYRFKPGDMVRCVDAFRSDMKLGRVYTVCGVDRDGWPFIAESRGFTGNGWWDPERFELVPDDDSVFRREPTVYVNRYDYACLVRETVGLRIDAERRRQDAKFGPHGNLGNMPPFQRLSVLTEEVGELAQALNDMDPTHAMEELVQVAAVAVCWLELLEEHGVNA